MSELTPEPTPPQPTPEPPKPDETDWAKLFEGMTAQQVKDALGESRKWEDRSKQNFDKAKQLDALLGVLNPGSDDPDPQKLAADLTAAQKDANQTKLENEVLRTAARHGADPVRLADSRSFMNKIGGYDPTASDFAAKVAAAIKKAVEDDGSFKTHQPASPKPNLWQGSGDPKARLSGREAGLAEAAKRFPQAGKTQDA